MRKLILTMLLLSGFAINAQQDYWEEGIKESKEFYKILDDVKSGKQNINKLIEQLNTVDEYYKYAASMSKDYEDAYKFNMSSLYYELANYYMSKQDFANLNIYIKKAFEQWPRYSSLNATKVTSKMPGTTIVKMNDFYAEHIQVAIIDARQRKDNKRVLELSKMYEDLKRTQKNYTSFFIEYYAFQVYKEQGNVNDAFKFGTESVLSFDKMNDAQKKVMKVDNDNTIQWLINANQFLATDVLKLADHFKFIKQHDNAILFYNKYLDFTGKNTSQFVATNIAEYAKTVNNADLLGKALSVLESIENKRFTESDHRTIAQYYAIINNKTKEKENIAIADKMLRDKIAAENKLKRQANARKFRQGVSLSVSTNPIMFLYQDNIWAFNFRTGKVMHEYRRANINNPDDGRRFGAWKHKSGEFNYQGLEQSYTMKFLNEKKGFRGGGRRNAYVGKYWGLQYRWASYDPADSHIMVYNPNGFFEQALDFNAEIKRKEATFIMGYMLDNARKWFHMDFYWGLGVGHRELITKTNLKQVDWDNTYDQRYNPENWNKFYMAARFGLRIGINIL
jgi:hypothetical protein